ncbi:MAG: hypothetical protein Q9207_001008 [Kuettlingeria erythrocarpa]
MRGQACRAVSTVLQAPTRTPSRSVAGPRYALLHRNLHSSQQLLYADPSPDIPETAHTHGVDNSADSAEKNSNASSGRTSPGSSDAPSEPPGKPVDNGSYGSALRRKGRNLKKSTGIPPFQLLERFLEENACLREDPPTMMQKRTGIIVGADTSSKAQTPKPNKLAIRIASFYAPMGDRGDAKLASQVQDPAATKQNLVREMTDLKREIMNLEAAKNDNSPVWMIDVRILKELEFMVRAGLADPAREQINSARSKKPDLVLHYPRKGGTVFLDALIRHLVDLNHADLIKLDAQDLAEIGGEFLDEPEDTHSEPLSSLGYVVHAPEEAQDPFLGLRDDTAATTANSTVPNSPSNRPGTVMVIPANSTTLPSFADLLQGLQGKLGSSGSQQQPQLKATGATAVESTRDLKLAVFLDTILHACDAKRGLKYSKAQPHERATPNPKQNVLGPAVQPGNDTNQKKDVVNTQRTIEGPSVVEQRSVNDLPESAPTLVLQIKDYPEIFRSESGYKLLVALHNALYQRRMEGQRVILIGTCTAENPDLADPAASINNLLQEFDTGLTRNIMTPPILEGVSDGLIQLQHWVENAVINYKHLRHMIRRLAASPEQVDNTFTAMNMMISTGVLDKLHSRVWSPEYIHRVSTLVTGIQAESGKALNMQHLTEALELAEGSDEAKSTWLSSEKEKVRNRGSKNKTWSVNRYGSGSKKDRAQLEKECNRHEKKLLNGMIDPSDIRTTFENVHASKETIQTLKDLTLLPLACPQEFDYGVLAEQSISGLLLYGPPGTGKTLLAKAVAKEGGATILEISGADLYDKYVGEGEKLVKAMFSLARKLKPCIVFIDEVDAILGSRDGGNNRTSHRDLINQFLREWDGMKEVTALIMVATNRPFDLDDAVVRRLPRRILVDLPTEKDREGILRILLKSEVLDAGVSLAKLAADTPLYSGSDLKHLVVTAAQACVRENYESANSASSSPSGIAAASPSSSPQSPPASSPLESLPKKSPPSIIPMPSILSPSLHAHPSPSSSPVTETPTDSSTTKRILRPHHFARAMEEISASVSEDMGSLTAIKKFDEKYGDRRGRKKKASGGFGFRTLEEGEREKLRGEGARVR